MAQSGVPMPGFTPLLKSSACLETEALLSHLYFSLPLKPNALGTAWVALARAPAHTQLSASIMEEEGQNNDMTLCSSSCCPYPQQGMLRQAANTSVSHAGREKWTKKAPSKQLNKAKVCKYSFWQFIITISTWHWMLMQENTEVSFLICFKVKLKTYFCVTSH